MYQPYVRISTGNLATVLDNNALNPVGCVYSPPANQALPQSTAGFGAQPVVKYLQYKSTSQPTPVAGPAPVYYTDESFTTVSGNAAEAYVTTNGLSIAGYLLPNTTAIPTLTAAILQLCYVWVQVGGLIRAAWAPTTSPGVSNQIGGLTTGNWASSGAATGRQLGFQLTAAASSLCDVLVCGDVFWGS